MTTIQYTRKKLSWLVVNTHLWVKQPPSGQHTALVSLSTKANVT